jgi:non-heme chloroperoxidase
MTPSSSTSRRTIKARTTRLFAIVGAVALLSLLIAPIWSPSLRFGLPSPPGPGTRVPLPSGHFVNVFDEGAGRPVVLVHGMPGSAHDWRPLPAQLVSAGFRVIRYDRVGYGHSSRRAVGESHSVESNVRDLLDLVTVLRLEAPLVVGWSYGGAVAQQAARQRPSAVAALLLIASDGPTSRPSRLFATVFDWTLPLRRWAIKAGFPVRVGVRRMAHQAFKEGAPAWWPAHAMTVVSPDGVARTWTKEVTDFDPAALGGPAISVPVTIMHGSADTFVRPHVSEALHGHIQGSTLIAVPGAGHMLPNTHAPLIVKAVAELASARHQGSLP